MLVIALLNGCSKQSGSATNTSDTTATTTPAPPPPAPMKCTNPITTITPGAANNSVAMTVGMPATVPSGNNGDAVIISAYFIGSANQSVTVTGAPGIAPLQSTTPNVWSSRKILPIATLQTLTVTATDGGAAYNLVSTLPGLPGVANQFGVNVSNYSNGKGDVAIVVVQDTAVTTP